MSRPSLSPAQSVVLTILLAAVPAAAQNPGASLSGDVVDESGARIATAVLVIRHESRGTELRLTTDNGEYSCGNLTPGEYTVTASAPGFAVTTLRVSLPSGGRQTLRFELPVGALTEDIVVLATEVAGGHEALRRLPGSVEILEHDTLERSRVVTTNEALRKVPGVHVRDEEGFGLRPNIGIRGINPTRSNKTLLLEDGIPLTYAPYGDNASYYHPPIERFERIEVMKGGAQIAYGPQTVGGLVNFVTPLPPTDPAAAITLTAGDRRYFNGHATYGVTLGRSGVLFDYMRKQGDGARENVSSDLNDVTGKLVHTFSPGKAITLRGNYYSEDSTVTYSGLRLAEYEADPRSNPFGNDSFSGDRYGASATPALTFANAALTANVYFSSFRRHWWRQSSHSSQRPNDSGDPACGGMANLDTTCGNEGRLRQYSAWGVEPRLRVHHRMLGVTNETDVGVRLHFERQDREQRNGSTPTARTGVLVEDNLRTNAAQAGFLQNRFLLGDWTVTPGVRVEHVEYERTNHLANGGLGATGRTSLTRLVPGLGVSQATSERFTWFAGVHRGFAPPRTEDVISNTGGVVDLDPELSWNYEVGGRSTLQPGIRLDGTVFVTDYENQIVPASLAGGVGAALTNGGATLHRGFELMALLDSAPLLNSAHNLYVRAAYTALPVAQFVGVRFSNVPGFGGVSVTGNRLPYAPEHLATIGAGYVHPSGVDAMIEAVYTSSQFGDDLNTVDSTSDGQRGLIPGYMVWNTAVSYAFRRATAFVTVKNLLDELFIVDRARGILPGSPRLVQAGIRLRF
ncbi:MAG TPA: TonB-dependent receptor [Vicinamibacterales bacterium]|nr:TonB-dependent receptor [Vicinamibacterales bacterium]